MRSVMPLLLAPVVVAACDPQKAAPPAPDAQPALTTAPSAPSPPRAPSVTITNLAPGELEIEASGPVKLASVARIERKVDGGWSPLPELDRGKGHRLVER